MSLTKRLWIGLGLLLGVTFAVLLWMGHEVYRAVPPLPQQVISSSDIESGRQVWQSFGGQQLGSIWGHGALIAPDWSADWLHREAEALLDLWAQRTLNKPFHALSEAEQDAFKAKLRQEIRPNTYDAENGILTVSDDRARAIAQVAEHYLSLFGSDSASAKLRETYAMRDGTVDTAEHRRELTGFFFWTSWAAVTDRPGSAVSYTSNWPYEPLAIDSPIEAPSRRS